MNSSALVGRAMSALQNSYGFLFSVQAAVDLAGRLQVPLPTRRDGESMTENVFGVSKKGEVIWQIERIPEISIDPTNDYTGVFSRLKLSKWSGHGVEIDANTGKVIQQWFGK